MVDLNGPLVVSQEKGSPPAFGEVISRVYVRVVDLMDLISNSLILTIPSLYTLYIWRERAPGPQVYRPPEVAKTTVIT
jgi:hypothetical protein